MPNEMMIEQQTMSNEEIKNGNLKHEQKRGQTASDRDHVFLKE